MSDSIIIKGGRVIDPSQELDEIADITISGGRIAHVGSSTERGTVIDAAGCIVCPGLIDMHVHLREPGNEEEETIASGSAAAVAGGFTSIACMPNTQPAIDTEAMIEFVYRQAARANTCNVYPIGAITKGRGGKELAEMGQMVRAGAVAFSDDGCGVANPMVMLRAFQYATMFDRVLIQHCEDADMAAGGVMNAGFTATRIGLPGIPAIAEEMMIQRDLLLAAETRARYHVAHISTAGGVQLVREGKKQGIHVTTEVCPHHLLLTEESVATYDTNYKMNPPLRSKKDVDACISGVIDGTIDCLVTDHAPHGIEEKEHDIQNAPFGIVGLETALGLFASALIEPGHIGWPRLIAMMTTHPARILGIDRGSLKRGAIADVTIIDPTMKWTADVSALRSRSRNSPFGGWQLTGRATETIVGGRLVFSLRKRETPVAA
ncbi:MAG: dihydroorotase [Planctomycetota bacterium]|nr:MAG: dihydroorotase [Planctomycetota bacterium]